MKRFMVLAAAFAGAAFMGAAPASAGSSCFSISFSSFGSRGSWGGGYVSRPVYYGCRPARYVYRPSYVCGPTSYRARSYARPYYYTAPVVCRPVRTVCARPVATSCGPRYVKARRVGNCVATRRAESYARVARPIRLPAYTRAQSPAAYAVMPGGTPVAKFAGRF